MDKTTERVIGKDIHSKYAVQRVSLSIINVFCYVMLGFAILFFVLGIIGIVFPPLLIFLPLSFQLALSAFVLLIVVHGVQLLRDIEMNSRQMLETISKK